MLMIDRPGARLHRWLLVDGARVRAGGDWGPKDVERLKVRPLSTRHGDG
jgi:hypothetical protein